MANHTTSSGPTASWTAFFPKRQGKGGQHAPGLLYELSVNNFLQAFIEPSNPFSPKNPDDVINDLKGIWTEHGFLPVVDLTMSLLRRYRPATNPKAANVLQHLLNERYDSYEPLTGFRRKPFAPLTTGLAHLYGITTGRPVTIIEGDMSNMGATNEHFCQLLALRDGITPAEVPASKVRQLTDQAAYIATSLAAEALQRAASSAPSSPTGRGEMMPFRTGGDEIRFICTDMTQEEVQSVIETEILPQIEDFTAAAGLHEHAHGKYPHNRWRSGFGLALTSIALDRNTRPDRDMGQADKRLKQIKHDLGAGRRGRLGSRVLPLQTHAKENVPDTLSRKDLLKLARQTGYFVPASDTTPSALTQSLQATFVKHGLIDASAPPLQPADSFNLLQLELGHQLNYTALLRRTSFQALKAAADTLYPAQHPPMSYDEPATTYNLDAGTAKRLIRNYSRLIRRQYARFYRLNESTDPTSYQQDAPSAYNHPLERDLMTLRVQLNNKLERGDQTTQRMFEKTLDIFNPLDNATGLLMGDVMPRVFGWFSRAETDPNKPGSDTHFTKFGYRACLHNLSGLNNTLGQGSGNADAVLWHFAQHIVMGGFVQAGIKANDVVAGHQDGGNIVAALTISERAAKNPALEMEAIDRAIHQRMKEFLKQPVADFLRQRGKTPPENMAETLLFSDIKDPRRSHAPGVGLTTCYIELKPTDEQGRPLTGGANLSRLVEASERNIDAFRKARKQQFTNDMARR